MEFQKENIKLICADNMKIMAQYSDDYFDLAVLDPEYGIGVNKMTLGNGKNKIYRGTNEWDNKRPSPEYFAEVQRISKNQIIWGGNYFADLLPAKMGWILWDKGTGKNDFADGELAWTSFDKALRIFKKSWVGANAKDCYKRIHPTEKPIKLYDFCFDFAKAKKDWKIIDTNFGSASSAISAYFFGFAEYIGIEIDKKHFDDGVLKFKNETMQKRLF